MTMKNEKSTTLLSKFSVSISQIKLDQIFDRVLRIMFPNAEQGLRYPVFRTAAFLVPMVNIELACIDSNGKVLLTRREASSDIPAEGWHLPGGIIRVGEKLTTRIKKTAMQEMGFDIINEKIISFSETIVPNKISRRHFISFLAVCEPQIKKGKLSTKSNQGSWFGYDELPNDLIVNHERYRNLLEQLCKSKGRAYDSMMFIKQCEKFEAQYYNKQCE